jgi:glycosyltransferase involved in cell wall biosynthesis
MNDVTAVVLTYNERENIKRTLDSITWIPRVLVIDSFSTDETCAIASDFENVEVVKRAFDTHATQWNFGLANVSSEWAFSLDADYEVSEELAVEIKNLNPSSETGGYSAQFEFRIFGRALRTSVYPPRTVLFRPARAKYIDEGHTQMLQATGRVEALRGRIIHDDRKPLRRWLASQSRYVELEAQHLIEADARELSAADRLRKRVYYGAPVMFVYLLVGRGLILDGWPGWFYVCQRVVAEFLLSMRLLIDREWSENAAQSASGKAMQ